MLAYILRYFAARLVWSAFRPRRRKARKMDDWQ